MAEECGEAVRVEVLGQRARLNRCSVGHHERVPRCGPRNRCMVVRVDDLAELENERVYDQVVGSTVVWCPTLLGALFSHKKSRAGDFVR